MRIITSAGRSFVPAGHENPLSPGVLKKVLLEKADLQAGRIQMINWASLGAGKRFARHYHEDMQEIFILVQGEAEITVAAKTATLRRGDAVVIDPREVHQMRNASPETVEYLAIGITSEAGGKTVVVDESSSS
jgi:mannose-6-phosphate isomerase-like protein (cupin superfamily)